MTAFYAGLDVSDQSTAICVIDAKGKIVQEDSVATTPEAIALALKPYKKVLGKVAHESGTKAAYLQKGLERKRFPMVCLDARVTSAALKAQRNKTDKNDARGIAKVVRSGWYYAKSLTKLERPGQSRNLSRWPTVARSGQSNVMNPPPHMLPKPARG